tara:strand:+ start:239 stop:613 length:375 start_codon:yes stop_codon:yes gene_type:complete
MKKYLVLIMIFVTSLCGAQDLLTSDNFKKETSRGIVVVEFWAAWNDANSCEWLENLKDCETYRVDIGVHMKLQQEYDISAIPTLIIFNNGNVEEVIKPNIMFQLEADKKEVQGKVDEIILKQFN